MNTLIPKTDKSWSAFSAEFLCIHVLPLNDELEKLTGIDPEISEEINKVIVLLYHGKITTNTAKTILRRFWVNNVKIEDQLKEDNFFIIDDPYILYSLCLDAIEETLDLLNRCRDNPKSTGALIGKVMKNTKGRADSETVKGFINFFVLYYGAINFRDLSDLTYFIEGLTN